MSSELSYGEVIKDAMLNAAEAGDMHAVEEIKKLIGNPERLTQLLDSLHADLPEDDGSDDVEPDGDGDNSEMD